MGIFNKLFDTHSSSEPFKNNNFQDNNLPNVEISLKGDFKYDIMRAITELGKELKKNNAAFDSVTFLYSKLTDESIIKIPVVFTIKGITYGLFYINTSEEASFFNYIRANSHLLGNIIPIYLSTIDLTENKVILNNINRMQWIDLEYNEQAELIGEFAIWWNTPNDISFVNSKTKIYLEEIYNLVDGYEEYFFGFFLVDIKMKGFSEPQKVRLPQKDFQIPINAPEGKVMIISVCQEKGIRFLFPIQTTTLEYRNSFLKQMLLTFKEFKNMLLEADYPKSQKQDLNGLEWFNLMTSSVNNIENSNEIKIGLVTIN